MRKIASIVILLLIAASIIYLKGGQIFSNINDDFYDIINDFIISEGKDVDLVVLEVSKAHKTKLYYSTQDGDSVFYEGVPPPLPPGMVGYYRQQFVNFNQMNLIDSVDIDYMFGQLDSATEYVLTPDKINKITLSLPIPMHLSAKDYLSVIKNIEEEYGTIKMLRFFTPLFSKDRKRAIFDIIFTDDGYWGSSSTFIMEKRGNKWVVVHKDLWCGVY